MGVINKVAAKKKDIFEGRGGSESVIIQCGDAFCSCEVATRLAVVQRVEEPHDLLALFQLFL